MGSNSIPQKTHSDESFFVFVFVFFVRSPAISLGFTTFG